MFRVFVISLSLFAGGTAIAQEQMQPKRVVGMSTRQGMRQGSYARFYRSSRGFVINQQEVARGQLARPEEKRETGDDIEGSLERRALERRRQLGRR
jgi:hypothetical protein